MLRLVTALLVAVSTAGAVTGCHTQAPAQAADTRSTAAPSRSPVPEGARAQLEQLRIAPRSSMGDYDRKKFPHWIDQGHGCNTRELVLKRAGTNVKAGADCNPTAGTWRSPYDNATWAKPGDLDIDHLVPLGHAWVSGAKSWTTERRQQFANDLDRPQLVAVTSSVNREKSDKAPDEWKPPLVSFWCTYATDWIAVKHFYDLTITAAEKQALALMLGKGTCPASRGAR
ncbi:HNH endonuclease family protein [Amycolatopsis sp. NPDC058986]|uniref:HNH endonuclease family protein n=1 Tax=unclassified Amycolatopsis TaxID=2618356 RepID=UPI00366F9E01